MCQFWKFSCLFVLEVVFVVWFFIEWGVVCSFTFFSWLALSSIYFFNKLFVFLLFFGKWNLLSYILLLQVFVTWIFIKSDIYHFLDLFWVLLMGSLILSLYDLFCCCLLGMGKMYGLVGWNLELSSQSFKMVFYN